MSRRNTLKTLRLRCRTFLFILIAALIALIIRAHFLFSSILIPLPSTSSIIDGDVGSINIAGCLKSNAVPDQTTVQLLSLEDLQNKFRPKTPNTLGAFVHISKTGGSSLTRLLKNGCHRKLRKPCLARGGLPRDIPKESAVSKLTTYYHVPDFINFRLFTEPHKFYLFTIRDPLERLISAYLFLHPSNQAAVSYHTARKRHANTRVLNSTEELHNFHYNWIDKGSHMNFNASIDLFSCFPSIQSYSSLLNNSDRNQKSHWEVYWKRGDCANVARSTLRQIAERNSQKRVTSANQFVWNLPSITHHLIPDNKTIEMWDTTILLTRTEHMVDDWISANRYLGQVGEIVTPPIKVIGDSSGIEYPVKNDLTEGGRKSLCLALANEYTIYFSLLVKAENLSNRDVYKSLEQAKRNCPWLDFNLPDMEKKG